MKPLEGKVCLVTGASRGVGKGIALGLGEAGATVIVTGRSTNAARGDFEGTIDETAAEVSRLGGKGIAIACDHADDAQVKALVDGIDRIDVLVNNVFAIPAGTLRAPFWELPIDQWDTMHRVGLRSHYVASHAAAPRMIARKSGLIVNVSSFGAKVYAVNVPYGVGKAALDRMSRDMARELAPHGVTVVSLWPGIVKTERVLLEKDRLGFDTTHGESPMLGGRAVAALAADPNVAAKSGKALVVAELAKEYAFTDVDGTMPVSLLKA